MSERVQSPIGFSDSELCGYQRDGRSLVVRVRSWNNRVLVVRFGDLIALKDTLAGEFSDLRRNLPASKNLLEEAVRRNFDGAPSDHPYQVYSFLNHDDEPSLEVVAATCEVSAVDDVTSSPSSTPMVD